MAKTKAAAAAAGGKKPPLLKRQQQKKSAAKPAASTKPLPPPVEVEEAGPANLSSDQDAYHLNQIFQSPEASAAPSAISSNSEPKPGEPLSAEAEQIVADIGGAPGEETEGDTDPAEVSEGLARISFDEAYVRDVLEEAYAWMGDKFQSEHWLLSERQSRMLGGPTTELLGSVWMHVQRLIPEILARWANSTPGLMDFFLVFGLVTGPKVAKQFAVSRQRRRQPQPRRPGAPVPVPPRTGGPVGPINTDVERFPSEGA